MTLQGKTEDGLTVTGRNTTSDSKATAVAAASGAFALALDLDQGRNTITLRTRDAAGNRGTARIWSIYRGNGRPTVSLRLSREQAKLAALPINLSATATVRDANGLPIEGARVTFTIAPPGPPTDVYQATTGSDGRATWSRIRLIRQGTTKGVALVTARVVLPNGRTASRKAEFDVK